MFLPFLSSSWLTVFYIEKVIRYCTLLGYNKWHYPIIYLYGFPVSSCSAVSCDNISLHSDCFHAASIHVLLFTTTRYYHCTHVACHTEFIQKIYNSFGLYILRNHIVDYLSRIDHRLWCKLFRRKFANSLTVDIFLLTCSSVCVLHTSVCYVYYSKIYSLFSNCQSQ